MKEGMFSSHCLAKKSNSMTVILIVPNKRETGS